MLALRSDLLWNEWSQSWFLLMVGLCLAVYGLWNFYVYSKRGINTSKNILWAQKMRLVISEIYPWKIFRFITWHFLFIIWKNAALIDSFESKIILSFSPVRLGKRNEIPFQAKSHLSYPQDLFLLLLFLTFRLGQHSRTQFNWNLFWIQIYFTGAQQCSSDWNQCLQSYVVPEVPYGPYLLL